MRPPGPSTLGFVKGLATRGFLATVGDAWREHGDVFEVRLGSRRMLFAMHPDAVKHVNVTNREGYDKLASYDTVREFLTGQGLVASTGDVWRRQRRLMAPFFTPAAVGAYADVMIRDAVELADRWDGMDGQTVEIAEEMTRVTAAIILRSMFSTEQLESIHRMKDAVETMIAFANRRLTLPPLPMWVPTPMHRRYKAARAYVHHEITTLIGERRAVPESDWPDDFLSRLMRARDPETGEPMSEELLRDESITIFFAGHETTARTMTFAWYALAANPSVAERLHEELDRELGGRTPTVEDLFRLPYTLQTVKEVLRMYPAAPFYMRDAIGADRIGDFDVEPGVGVMLSPYYTHRHPDFWEAPDTFDPDRWTPEREKARHKHAYHPFAAGPRICIGNNFSLLESHLLLAVLAQRFAPGLPEGYAPRWEMHGVLGITNGLPMVLRKR
ncbi:MAG: cytochrome P450 [Alphaproteobacteria bacterium]|nr:cytochrome P450 [Alphaproteobacteria bacterium]